MRKMHIARAPIREQWGGAVQIGRQKFQFKRSKGVSKFQDKPFNVVRFQILIESMYRVTQIGENCLSYMAHNLPPSCPRLFISEVDWAPK